MFYHKIFTKYQTKVFSSIISCVMNEIIKFLFKKNLYLYIVCIVLYITCVMCCVYYM
nr:MAG TPA: hypothetical protein [Caudoviricetes sp.]